MASTVVTYGDHSQYKENNNKNLVLHEKTETPAPYPLHHQDLGIITPPMSPVRASINDNSLHSFAAGDKKGKRLSNNSHFQNNQKESTANSPSSGNPYNNPAAKKLTAGQTGLPWLTHDADGEHFFADQQQQQQQEQQQQQQPLTNSPIDLSFSSSSGDSLQQQKRGTVSPPPKFRAKPRTLSSIGFPTRKRTLQKHIYSMKDGLEPVKTLCKRLISWQASVKFLLKMFRDIKKVESSTGKGYRKIDSKYDIPAKIRDHFKTSNGVQDAWFAFKEYTRENSLIHEDFVDFIDSEIVPVLHVMLKDIHTMMQSLKHNKGLYTTELWDCRKKADRKITKLHSDLYTTMSNQEKTKSNYFIPKRDPLLTKYVVIASIKELYCHENRLHRNFLDAQDNYRQFEQEKIINVYTDLFSTFETFRIQHHLETLEGVNRMAAILKAIETDSEYWEFVHHHENQLVKVNAAFKNKDQVYFPNDMNPLVQPLMEGTLQRYSSKKWHDEYYILSPIGLLYRFKNKEHLLNTPLKPEASLFVPQCTLVSDPNNQIAVLKGKLLHSFFGTKKTFELSSVYPTVLAQWITALEPMVAHRETAVIKTTPPPQQPIPQQQQLNQPQPLIQKVPVLPDNRSVHSKIQTDEEQPPVNDSINTDAVDSSSSNRIELPTETSEERQNHGYVLPPIDTGAARLTEHSQANNDMEAACTSPDGITHDDSRYIEPSAVLPQNNESTQLPSQQCQQERELSVSNNVRNGKNRLYSFIPVANTSAQMSERNSLNEGEAYGKNHTNAQNSEYSTHAPISTQQQYSSPPETNDAIHNNAIAETNTHTPVTPSMTNIGEATEAALGPDNTGQNDKNSQETTVEAPQTFEHKVMPGGPMRQASDVFWVSQ